MAEILRTVLKVGVIKNNPNNPRLIKDDKFSKLVQSIKDFPEMLETREIVVNTDNIILGGNMRFKAAVEAGLKEVPVKIVDWSEEKQREFVIKDNVSGGEWDWDLITNEWDAEQLDEWGLDVPYNEKEPEIEEDEAPELDGTGHVSSVLGTVYKLGRHRVMCGSATSIADAEALLGDKRIDLYLTDPPYNVDYEGGSGLKIMNDSMSDSNFLQFLKDSYIQASAYMKKGAPFYIFHADSEGYNFRGALKATDLTLKQCLIWVKNTMVLGRQDYQWQHEPILYGWKDGEAHKWYGKFDKKTIIDDGINLDDMDDLDVRTLFKSILEESSAISADKPSRNGEHPTMKPIKLIAKLIFNSSKKNDLVYDNFLGSGSTLIAAEQTSRTCYGTELDPRYVDVIRKRYHKFVTDSEEGWEDGTPEA